MAAHVERHPSKQGQLFCRVVRARPGVVLPDLPVQDPLLAVVDAPITSYPVGKPGPVRERAQLVALCGRRLVAPQAGRCHAPPGLEAGPRQRLG
jgi:hypothetical protein